MTIRHTCILATFLAALPGAAARADFTFAHVTDTHVTAELSRYAGTGLRDDNWVKSGAAKTWSTNRQAITDAVNRADPDFVLVTGDLSETGANMEFTGVVEWARSVKAPVYLLPGNHDAIHAAKPASAVPWRPDVGNRGLQNYERIFGRGFYGFHHDNAYFIVLTSVSADKGFQGDAYQNRRLAEQDGWLDRELRYANAAGYPFVFVFRHHPFAPNPELAETLGAAGTSAFVFGHIHRFTSPVVNGVQCISGTSAKGAANDRRIAPSFGLVTVGSEQATYQLYSTEGEPLFDPVTVKARATSREGLWGTRARLFPELPAATCETLLSSPEWAD